MAEEWLGRRLAADAYFHALVRQSVDGDDGPCKTGEEWSGPVRREVTTRTNGQREAAIGRARDRQDGVGGERHRDGSGCPLVLVEGHQPDRWVGREADDRLHGPGQVQGVRRPAGIGHREPGRPGDDHRALEIEGIDVRLSPFAGIEDGEEPA